MTESFIELTPRSKEHLLADIAEIEASDIPFDGYNLPEIIRHRPSCLTPEQLLVLRQQGMIPVRRKLALHLRTRERSIDENVDRVRMAALKGATVALLVTGDPLHDGSMAKSSTHDVLPHLAADASVELAVCADIYRPDWGRWREKCFAARHAAVDRVFTQPVFHPSMLSTIIDETRKGFERSSVHIGVTWMHSERGREYWRNKNLVPADHLPAGKSDDAIRRNSLDRAADILEQARSAGFSTYLMLMRGTVNELIDVYQQGL